MAGENLSHSPSEMTAAPFFFAQNNSPEANSIPESAFVNRRSMAVSQQLELDWGDVSFKNLNSDPPTGALQKPLAQESKSRKSPVWQQVHLSSQTERIQDLEQALDQCQVFINELKLQLADQQFLEAQLAATEEISNIQQQAIIALKTQLANQQGIERTLSVVGQPRTTLPVEIDCVEAQVGPNLTDAADRVALEQQVADLQALLAAQEGQAEELESQNDLAQTLTINLVNQLGETQKKVADLQNQLRSRQTTITDLEIQLQRTKSALSTQQEITTALQQTQAPESEKNKVIQGLSKNLLSAHTKIEALETEFSYQLKLQAKLQHSCRELEDQSSLDQDRIAELEQQVAEMQEQILKQAQQASEYEAAIQHWKDRYFSAEHSVLQLKSLLERILKDRPDNFSELVAFMGSSDASKEATPSATNSTDSESFGIAKGLKVNLPGFLNLRRNHR